MLSMPFPFYLQNRKYDDSSETGDKLKIHNAKNAEDEIEKMIRSIFKEDI